MVLQSSNAVMKNQQTIFQLIGFDRLSFVDDITHAVPQNEQCRITNLLLEGDGVRAKGQLTVYVADAYYLALIDRQLRLVSGLVSINQLN